MPITSEVGEIVRTKMSGRITFDDLMRHAEFVCSLEPTSDVWIEFTDQRDVEAIEISSEQASQIIRSAESLQAKYAWIHNVVLVNNPAVFGVTRMAETYATMGSANVKWHLVRTGKEADELILALTRTRGERPASPDGGEQSE